MKSIWIEGKETPEGIEKTLEMEREFRKKEKRAVDPFFQDREVFAGPAPSDSSLHHDDYLYGGKD